DVGDEVTLGELAVRIDAVLTYRPDQSIGFSSLAPSLLVNIDDIPRSGLISEGSRVGYALLVAGDESAVDGFYEDGEDRLLEAVGERNREVSSERGRTAADRAPRLHSLDEVISLLLSTGANAMSAFRFAHRLMDTVALMRSLGAS